MEEIKPVKRPVGKPITSDVKNNPTYFVDYYHKRNVDYLCPDCKCMIKFNSKRTHLKSKRHNYLTEYFKILGTNGCTIINIDDSKFIQILEETDIKEKIETEELI
jgi:hypothetical protein